MYSEVRLGCPKYRDIGPCFELEEEEEGGEVCAVSPGEALRGGPVLLVFGDSRRGFARSFSRMYLFLPSRSDETGPPSPIKVDRSTHS